MKATLYGSPISPFSRKVAIVLEEKGLEYEWLPVRPHDPNPEFQEASPLGVIPAYRDEQVALSDSSVICQYLEALHPTPALYPQSPALLARALWWEEYFDSGLIVPMRNIFFQKWMYPLLRGIPTDEKILQEGYDKLPAMLEYLETRVPKEGWIVGDMLTIADISLAIGFQNLKWAGHAIDWRVYPTLVDYISRLDARPSFAKTTRFGDEFIAQVMERVKK